MKNPPLITLIPLVILSLVSCEQERGAVAPPLEFTQPEPQVRELKDQLSELQTQLRDERELRLKQNSAQTVVLAELKNALAEMAEAKKAPSMEAPVIQQEELDEDAEASRMARRSAQGEKHVSLTTVSGTQYHDSVISRVTDIGVVIRHRGGVARISFTDLSPAWQERFYYNEERAVRAQKNETLAQAKQERATEEAAMALEKQKQADATARSLADLAEEVERLKKRAAAPAPGEPDQIVVRPPIILNQRSHSLNQIYHPSILRSPLVRSPVVRTNPKLVPTVRSSRSVRTTPSRSVVPQRSRAVIPKQITPQRR